MREWPETGRPDPESRIHEQNVRDARELTALAKSIELDFDKNDQNVLSIALLKKLDDVDKLTKRIRGRVRRLCIGERFGLSKPADRLPTVATFLRIFRRRDYESIFGLSTSPDRVAGQPSRMKMVAVRR